MNFITADDLIGDVLSSRYAASDLTFPQSVRVAITRLRIAADILEEAVNVPGDFPGYGLRKERDNGK